LNQLDHLVMAGRGSNLTWVIAALRSGKMTDEGVYV
jgi:hypothetical protein